MTDMKQLDNKLDAGYVYLPDVKPGDFITVNAGTYLLNGDGTMTQVVRLTGQEWYDRYQTEKGFGSLDNLKDMPHPTDYAEGIDVAVMKCDEAAKRAAGIEEDN